MKKAYSSREIFINEIQFERIDVIYLFGFIRTEGKFKRSRFVCNRKLLYELLTQNGKVGQEIILLIRQLLKYPHANPFCIDIIDCFGTTQPLKAFSIQMQIPLAESDFEQVSADSVSELLFIERIIPFPAT